MSNLLIYGATGYTGQLIVKDAEGNLVTTLEITGPNLERWLIDADVKILDNDDIEGGLNGEGKQ